MGLNTVSELHVNQALPLDLALGRGEEEGSRFMENKPTAYYCHSTVFLVGHLIPALIKFPLSLSVHIFPAKITVIPPVKQKA